MFAPSHTVWKASLSDHPSCTCKMGIFEDNLVQKSVWGADLFVSRKRYLSGRWTLRLRSPLTSCFYDSVVSIWFTMSKRKRTYRIFNPVILSLVYSARSCTSAMRVATSSSSAMNWSSSASTLWRSLSSSLVSSSEPVLLWCPLCWVRLERGGGFKTNCLMSRSVSYYAARWLQCLTLRNEWYYE